ncbi:hypothetical protein GOBAR_AA09275 [Gossypium barbadense]|uniref:PNO1 second type I KH domain-containing protein n=1 Tax=Gossypium barbadense TaxID=3634 RepID=A0A2P5Y719_GOSBA|nr:hypothetical protein GOBAR_AA09275 [Gossypium barbadense]
MNIDIHMNLKAWKDVKSFRGDHLSRAVGRLSDKSGKTKFAIENATKTKIVIAVTKIDILGSFANIKIVGDSLYSLILGSLVGKVYSKLRQIQKTPRGQQKVTCTSLFTRLSSDDPPSLSDEDHPLNTGSTFLHIYSFTMV